MVGARRAAAVLMAISALGIGAIVVLGMATGYELEFDRGTAMAGVRDLQIALGAITLVGLVTVLATVRGFYLGESAAAVPAFAVTVLVAVAWAFARVIEYSA
jgi:hypothetical protein